MHTIYNLENCLEQAKVPNLKLKQRDATTRQKRKRTHQYRQRAP